MSNTHNTHQHDSHAAHGAHDGHDDHGHHDDAGLPHASFKGYMTGFVLAVILTAIPFALVMTGSIENSRVLGMWLLGLGAVQIVVHMVYFLHMDFKTEGGWSMLALIFTILFVVITLAGSLWVMYHMNTNMMPHMPSAHDMRTAP